MGSDLHVGIVGATGAVGKDILEVLHHARWRPEKVVAAASPGTAIPFVDYGDESIPVEDARHLDTGALDVVVLAAPEAASRDVGERALDDGIPVIDVSGAFAGEPDVPMVVPWVNPEALANIGLRGVVAVPGAPALLLASALGPLARAGIVGDAHATVLVPASSWGRDGIEELSRQVVALLNAGTPPRKIFPDGLAFDLMPSVGLPGEDGWTDREARVTEQVHALLGAELPLSVSLVGVPVFSGTSADLTIRLGRRVLPDLAARILADGGVSLPTEAGSRFLPRPRRVEGQPFLNAGRLRTSEDGTRLHLWLGLDNLRATATAAVSLVAAAMRDRISEG